jgi:hypothetical protein
MVAMRLEIRDVALMFIFVITHSNHLLNTCVVKMDFLVFIELF